jgi:hypothetical protein
MVSRPEEWISKREGGRDKRLEKMKRFIIYILRQILKR